MKKNQLQMAVNDSVVKRSAENSSQQRHVRAHNLSTKVKRPEGSLHIL